jgi:Na+-transporting methylmalonyl-CoA/oxaloacetate decarboxylase beta subunit
LLLFSKIIFKYTDKSIPRRFLPRGDDRARVSQVVGQGYDRTNHLLMHAMGTNVAGVIGSAVAAGILLSFLY